MSLEENIRQIVSEAMADKYVSTMPTYASKEVAASILGISPQSLDRLFAEGSLSHGQHVSQFRKNGRNMYYMPEILKTLAPSRASIRIFGDPRGK